MNGTTSFVEHRVPREGGMIYARTYEGTGPAFVLMHGFPDNLHIYDDLVPYLVAAGRRVVAFDFLGFGDSDKPTGAIYGFKQQLGDLEAIVEALDLDRIIPVGHDAGGPAAINFAIEHPDRVDSLCILNTFYAAAPTTSLLELIQIFATASLESLARAILQSPEQLAWLLRFQQKRFHDALPEGQRAHFRSFLGPIIDENFSRQPGSGEAFAQIASQLSEEVARNAGRLREVEALDIPANLIWGEADPYLTRGVAEDLRSHLKHSSLHMLSGGHWLQVDAPEQVAEVMLS